MESCTIGYNSNADKISEYRYPVSSPLVKIALVCAGTLNCKQAYRLAMLQRGLSQQMQQIGCMAYLLCSVLHHCCKWGLLWNVETAPVRSKSRPSASFLVNVQSTLTLGMEAWDPK